MAVVEDHPQASGYDSYPYLPNVRAKRNNVWALILSNSKRRRAEIITFDSNLPETRAIEILRAGVSVVMDFAGNTVYERSWVRSLFEAAGADALNDLKTSSVSLRISRNGCS